MAQLSRPPRVIVDDDADVALVERCRHGDWTAFTELVVRYQRPIYNAAYWVLHKPEDANDITQVVFLKVAERLDEYDPRFKFFSWIYRIAVNESLNLLRRNGRDESLDDEADFAAPESSDPERQASDAEVAARIRVALMKMTSKDRLVLTLRHFSECSYDEIGEILELDSKTVKSRLFEARKRLRELLGDLH
jgi:RNA polymerase sigma-70 factor (ECF subfamily)